MEYVATNNAPGAIGPYSQAVKANGMLFTSGQIPINPETNAVEAETIEAQTEQVCKNLKAVVEAAGTSMDKVVKTVCFLADINDFAHTLTIGEAKWATLILGYNAAIPADVTVYAVSSIEGEYAMLTEVEDVIPANTAVLVNAETGDYAFKYAASAGSVVDNMLRGSVFNKNISEESYVLANKESGLGFYLATKNQAENTAFKNNAFKAYLPVAALGARFLGFNFGTETGIGEVETETENAVIYDLAGRRVQKAQKGLYIVNGKKVIK